jgi:hypothetical protein
MDSADTLFCRTRKLALVDAHLQLKPQELRQLLYALSEGCASRIAVSRIQSVLLWEGVKNIQAITLAQSTNQAWSLLLCIEQ